MATRFRARIFLTAFIVGSVAASATAAPVKYTVTPLGQLGEGDVIPSGMNNAGQVVGISRPEAFLYSNGVMTGLGMLPGHEESWAYAINNAGVAVGYSALDDDFGSRAVKWENGVIADLGDLGGVEASASGINDAGQIVGWAWQSPHVAHAFIWENGVMMDLGTFGGDEGAAYAINNSGHVVGYADDHAGNDVPFFWDGASMSQLVLPPGVSAAWPVAINDTDQIVGWTWTTGLATEAALWADGEITILPSLVEQSTRASDVNSFGDIVGISFLSPNDASAVLWQGGEIYDLNELVDSEFDGILTWATSINDSGQIVAVGNNDADFQGESFLLTPIPEPATGVSLVLLGAFLLRRSRKIRPISEGERHA